MTKETLEKIEIALECISEGECVVYSHPQQYRDGNCNHCRATTALEAMQADKENVIEFLGESDYPVKRFHMDKDINFKSVCPKCGLTVETSVDSLYYPDEGESITFFCDTADGCGEEFSIELGTPQSRLSYRFKKPDNLEVI